ncbi:hypothetical protein NKR19_g10395 [Coniochaeta hoffmannii]|uniref:Uncharacterized protein n=1 Tax=Coniochaeta hoffmannii TaxID=91930 RepID=A0AA38RFD0_9PEZI|nr:hypothetical protein NKR19_g10395 [Coniochaeta hoffmannii]
MTEAPSTPGQWETNENNTSETLHRKSAAEGDMPQDRVPDDMMEEVPVLEWSVHRCMQAIDEARVAHAIYQRECARLRAGLRFLAAEFARLDAHLDDIKEQHGERKKTANPGLDIPIPFPFLQQPGRRKQISFIKRHLEALSGADYNPDRSAGTTSFIANTIHFSYVLRRAMER